MEGRKLRGINLAFHPSDWWVSFNWFSSQMHNCYNPAQLLVITNRMSHLRRKKFIKSHGFFLWRLAEGAHAYWCMLQIHTNYTCRQVIDVQDGSRIFTIPGKLCYAAIHRLWILSEHQQGKSWEFKLEKKETEGRKGNNLGDWWVNFNNNPSQMHN